MRRSRHSGRWARFGLVVLLLASLLSVAPPWWPVLDLLAPWQLPFALAYLVVALALRFWPRFTAAFWKPRRAAGLVALGLLLHAGQIAWLRIPSFEPIADESAAEFDLLWWNLQHDSGERSAQYRFLQECPTDLVALGELTGPLAADLSFLDRPRPFGLTPPGSGLKLASRFPPLKAEVVELRPDRPILQTKLVVHRRHLDLFVVHNFPPATAEHHAFFDAWPNASEPASGRSWSVT